MSEIYNKVKGCLESIRKITDFEPKVAIVLGSGLGDYANDIKIEVEINYKDIEGFPVSTVPGHAGKFIFGYIDKLPVVCMKGRVHYYEGYSMADVVLPTRLMRMMGAEILFLTNASGGINPKYPAGTFMMITDHISNFVPNPLIGPNIEAFGTRFPDMSQVYDKQLQAVLRQTAIDHKITLEEGIYLQFSGPSFESPAEIKMAALFGADAVGMSTVVEAIVANHMGMKICGISCVCNPAAGISKTPLTHDEVQAAANEASPKFKTLVTESIKNIANIL